MTVPGRLQSLRVHRWALLAIGFLTAGLLAGVMGDKRLFPILWSTVLLIALMTLQPRRVANMMPALGRCPGAGLPPRGAEPGSSSSPAHGGGDLFRVTAARTVLLGGQGRASGGV
jgi:hypothetical protein